MGNAITIPHRLSGGGGTGKVLLSDGTVHEYDQPLTVAELMLEHPQHMVIELPGNVANDDKVYKRPAPLPADKKLEMKKVYVMIPIRRGKPAASLSSEEARRILLKANAFLKSKSLLSSYPLGSGGGRFLPLFGKMCAAGVGGKNRYHQEEDHDHDHHRERRNNKLLHIGYGEGGETKTNTPEEYCFSEILIEERPEFLSRQISGKGWKPSLDTITEKAVVHAKVRHWLF